MNEEYKNKMENEAFLSHNAIYSPKLNACVIKYGSVVESKIDTTFFYTIFNLNTGKEVYSYTYSRDKNTLKRKDVLGTKNDFEQIVLNLFGSID
mgnify:FL=1